MEFTLISVEGINAELNSESKDNNRFWYSIQGFLISVGNISKILFPTHHSNQISKERGKRLRSDLGISEKSILSDKKLRNCFEHYDEKLDDFHRKNNGVYVSKTITKGDAVRVYGETFGFYMRRFDINTKVLSYKGLEYNLQNVIDEIINLKQKIIIVMIKKGDMQQ